jgi:hypothetical protein
VWLVASTAIYPKAIITPWVILSLTYVFIVFMMILIGKELIDKYFGLLLGLITALSHAQISQSVNLTNPSLVALFSTLAVYFLIRYLKTGKNIFIFLLSLSVSLTINTHFQAMYLLIIIPLAAIFKRPSIKGFLYIVLGLIIPFIPYFIFELKSNFYNFRGMIDYIQYGQYKVYVANRWLTYVGVFWPKLWGDIVGGNPILGYFTIVLFALTVIISFMKKKLSREMILLIISFAIMFFALRFYRGERFFGYFVFLHPFVIIFSGFAYYMLYRINKTVGIFIILLVIFSSIRINSDIFTQKPGESQTRSYIWVQSFAEQYPGKKFQIYAYKNTSESLSLPLVLYLNNNNLIDNNGYKLGFPSTDPKERPHFTRLKETKAGYEVWDLNSSTSAQLINKDWRSVNPSAVYKTSADWYK